MAPDSRKSDSKGLLLPPRVSTALLSCDKAITGTLSSFAMLFNDLEIVKFLVLYFLCCLHQPSLVVSNQ